MRRSNGMISDVDLTSVGDSGVSCVKNAIGCCIETWLSIVSTRKGLIWCKKILPNVRYALTRSISLEGFFAFPAGHSVGSVSAPARDALLRFSIEE